MNRLVDWLLRPTTYAEHPAAVTLVETHVSWVFLTDHFAYKLKKPARFDFLDFGSIEARRVACENEVRLNRRLASDVYLGLAAVRADHAGNLIFDERMPNSGSPTDDAAAAGSNPATKVETPPIDSKAVDWLVKMRRLPSDRTLVELFRAGRLYEDQLRGLVLRLVEFYRGGRRLTVEPRQYREQIERHVRANREELLRAANADAGAGAEFGMPLPAIRRIHTAQLQVLALHPDLFDARAAAGRIVDGHGDLRPEHIYLLPEPVVLDCIEFNSEFRRLDVADEMSFLAMECDLIGAGRVGRQTAERTLAALGDRPPAELLAFYRCYRACVRAKVAALRSGQLQGDFRNQAMSEAVRSLELADRNAVELAKIAPPLLLVVHGSMGSGKSTLAAALSERFAMDLLASDVIRRELFGPSQVAADYGEAQYRPENRLAGYSKMFDMAESRLKERVSTALDATFPSSRLRQQAAALAERHGARVLAIHCVCPPEVALRRIANRAEAGKGPSEARPELYARQRAEEEPNPPGFEAIAVDTTESLAAQVTAVLERLRGPAA